MAEVIRGGLQAIPRGQGEAASALGLSWWKTTALIVMPQALRHVIPGLVNSFIALFKDTSLVLDRGAVRSAGLAARVVLRPGLGDADHAVHRLCLRRNDLFRFLFRDVALFAVRRAPAECPPAQLSKMTMTRNSIVSIAGLNKWYGDFHVLRDINLDVAQGRAHRDLRSVGLRQIDADPLHQRAGGVPGRPRSSSTVSSLGRICGGSTKSGARSAWCSRVSTCFRI